MYDFGSKLKSSISKGLPGSGIQMQMLSSNRLLRDFPVIPDPDARTAAVLILLFPRKGKVHTVFMQRPEYEGFHGGQISFPGGKKEKGDGNIIHTALREAEEETGIDSSLIEVAGTLTPLFIPVSRMVVTAVTAWTSDEPVFKPDPREVVFLIEADLTRFTDPSIVQVRPMKIRGEVYDIRYFSYEGHVIWGATAMMLNELMEIIRRERISLEVG